jgi:uncharacterized protein
MAFTELSIALSSILLIAATQPADRSGAAIDCSAVHANIAPYQQLAKTFQYDKSAPLNVNVISSSEGDGVSVESIEFAESNGGKCSGTLIVPGTKGRFPAVVWLGSGDKDWEKSAAQFSKLGAVSVVLDSCGDLSSGDASGFHDGMVQQVIDIRRAVDILSQRPDVDRGRIAFIGHSGGAMIGADAVAVDKRFKAAVFESGLQGFTYHICTSPHPYAVALRKTLDGRLLDFVSKLAPLDAIHYVGHEAPTVLLFQSATRDQGVTKSAAQEFFDAASQPKQLIWYDTGHEMTLPQVTKDRTAFLTKQLDMPTP